MPDQPPMPAKTSEVFEVLKRCARERLTITYGGLGRQVGLSARGAAKPLYCIRNLCLDRYLPPLTAIVIRSGDGLPGVGLTPAVTQVTIAETRDMQRQVFAYDWSLINLHPAN